MNRVAAAPMASDRVAWSTGLACAAVVLVYFHNTLPLLTTLPRVNVDEPWLIERAYQLITTGRPSQPMFLLDRPYLLQPGYSLVLAPWLKAFGVGLLQARLLAVCCGLATLASVFFIGSRLFAPAVGVLAAAFLATDSNFLGAVRFARTDAPAVCFAAASLALFVAAMRANRWPLYAASGMLAGAAMLCHANCYWVVAVAFGWCLLTFGNRMLMASGPWAYAAGFLLTFGPYAYVIGTHWREFNDQLKIFAADRVPSASWRTIVAYVSAERARYHDWYFGLITQTIANPLLWFFQLCVAAGAAVLVVRLLRPRGSRKDAVSERLLAVLVFGTAAIFAGFIPNKALVYLPHLLVGFAILAAWLVATLCAYALGTDGRRAAAATAVWMVVGAECVGAVGFYEYWYARMRQTTALVPYEATDATVRALVPAGRKYLFASPTFWLAFHDNPDVTFIANTAAGPYRVVTDGGLFTRRSLYTLPQDRPFFALVDDDGWKTLLLDEVGVDRTWRTSWYTYLANSCAVTSVAFGTAHGTLALFRCSNDRPPQPQAVWYVHDGTRLQLGRRVWTAAPSDLTRWPLYRDGTVVAPSGSGVRLTAERGGGVFTDIPVTPGEMYLASFDVERASVNDLATLQSVAPNGTLRESQWIKLARPPWFPGGALVRPVERTLRLYLFSESKMDFVVGGVQLFELSAADERRVASR